MKIAQAARASGVPAKMIRYYEATGVVPRAKRLKNGYRDYNIADVHRLRFICCVRSVGFPLETAKDLLGLWTDRGRSGPEVKAMALTYVAELEARAADLADIVKTLRQLARTGERHRRQPARIKSAGKRQ